MTRRSSLEDPHSFTRLTPLTTAREQVAAVGAESDDGRMFDALRGAVPDVRAEIIASGTPAGVTTCDLVTFPYPTGYALNRAAVTPAPYVWLTARMVVVQWSTTKGVPRTALWCPFDHEHAVRPSWSAMGLRQRPPLPDRLVATRHGTVLGHLRALGLDPEDVDYLLFPHLQAQDVRRLLGTAGAAPDLGARDRPLEPWFPHARLVLQAREWSAAHAPHPLQAPWYLPAATRQIPTGRVVRIHGDVLLGPGVALIAAPGRTPGAHSLVLHTDEGLWVASGNGVAADSWSPHASGLPGVRRWAAHWDQAVVPDAGMSASVAAQYTSMVVEAMVADPVTEGTWQRCLPSRELTPHPFAPMIAPTRHLGRIAHGSMHGSAVALEGVR